MKPTTADRFTLSGRACSGRRPQIRLVLLLGVALVGCSQEPPAASDLVAGYVAELPQDPRDVAWSETPWFRAPLLLQDMVEPRLLEVSTREVRVRALTDGRKVAFHLSWEDDDRNDLPGAARFADACAVQLPRTAAPDLPAPQMGEPGRGVAITYWRADWQAEVDGRPLDIDVLYPNASIDHYPFEAPSLTADSPEQRAMEKRYAPARGAGHPTHPPDRPVQDLLAEGPGTLTVASRIESNGRGLWMPEGWRVVLSCPLPEALRGVGRTQVAFAVWKGDGNEAGARKMRSAWVPLTLEVRP